MQERSVLLVKINFISTLDNSGRGCYDIRQEIKIFLKSREEDAVF